jgi:hypothetical protein
MRLRVLAVVALVATGAVALSLTRGQDAGTPPAAGRPADAPPVVPADYREPAPLTLPGAPAAPATPAPDLSKLTDTQQKVLRTAHSGALWLCRMNTPTGRFVYGFLPALDRRMEGDNFLHQAAAAATLARAARLTGDKQCAALATHAVLALVELESIADPKDPKVRYTTLPSIALNRLAAAGLLVAAIHELPNPQPDLLEKSDQLCNFIRRQARSNGSLCTSDLGDDGKPLAESAEAINTCPGPALYGLMLSQRHHPAGWKTDVVRKAVAYYHPWWKANKSMAFVPAQTAAYAEAYLLSKEPAFAACVFEMNDWLCGLQYDAPPVKSWLGGFPAWKDGHPVEEPPTVAGAAYGESVGRACRVARQAADEKRYQRYTAAVERNLLFLTETELQYTTTNTRHYDVAYREFLIGGFHPSPQDGNLRIDYTQQAVAAMLEYVER